MQEIAAPQRVASEQDTLLQQYVQQPEAQDPEQLQHLGKAMEELTLEVKLQHQRAAEAQAACEAQLKQQHVDNETNISNIHDQHITQLQQLTAEHTAALSKAARAAQAELCQQQAEHEEALSKLEDEMYSEVERQVAANLDATLQSWEAENMRQLEQLHLSLTDQHVAAMEALMVESEHYRLKGIFAYESKLQHAQRTIEALHLQLNKEQRAAEQLRKQLKAKVCALQLSFGSQCPTCL